MSEQYTIEQLQAMSDGELAELAARLRGWTLSAGQWFNGQILAVYNDHEGAVMPSNSWNPAADDAQAYGLLMWAMETHPSIEFHIHLMRRRPCIFICSRGVLWSTVMHLVRNTNARAMVYAFVLAMEALNG